MLPVDQIVQGDTLSILKTFPDDSIDCAITSPPYYGLRSYLPENHPDKSKEIGSESSLEEHLKVLLDITGEIKRVLKPSGSCWLNYGDCYSAHPAGNTVTNYKKWEQSGDGLIGRLATRNRGENYRDEQSNKLLAGGVKEKSLLMIPERIALRMIDQQGWILRSKIIWAKQIYDGKERRTKGSVMPTSVKDRFNNSYEYLFHFVKNKKYYFDLDAVRIPAQTLESRPAGIDREKEYPNAKRNKFAFNYKGKFSDNAEAESFGSPRARSQRKEKLQVSEYRNPDGTIHWGKYGEPHPSKNPRWNPALRKYDISQRQKELEDGGIKGGGERLRGFFDEYGGGNNPNGKNLPNVWLIGSEPSKELHFARFPTALCEIPIKSSCPKNGIVLDPFAGSGTTLSVARHLGRKYLGIELNADYIKLAEKRLAQKVLF